MSNNFHLAPPAKTVDGLFAVPIDIQAINALIVFDGAASSATVDATINFDMGAQNGNPIFDLRQTIQNAWLDGASFPVSQLAHHDFGGGAGAELRVIESVLAANSNHSLRLTYTLGLPQASTAGGYPPGLSWSAGPRLVFNFGFTDLGAGRYLESWLPANLIFDQFKLDVDLQVINTAIAHSVITNGNVTTIGTNHWQVGFPDRFTALSTLLEIRATDTIMSATDTVALPVSGLTVTIEAHKLSTNTATNLTTEINRIKTFLTDNENAYGPYAHLPRFVVMFIMGGMEYDGGTTATSGSLPHETFHSWFARGMKPASQPDGWWDEAFTSYHDGGANTSTSFDFTTAPKELCTQNPWSRITPSSIPSAYSDGERFWRGVSAEIGNGSLNNFMRDLYTERALSLVTTADIEEYLVSRSGSETLVDGFHRFVYGFNDPSSVPDIWIKDNVADPGNDYWAGTFWNSPDLWIRLNDDDMTAHQNPEYGQDNWFYARVRNQGPGEVKHFVITFNAKNFAGTEFIYPTDFLPSINAAAGFSLAASSSVVVKAKWPRANVPPAGTHSCLLAAIIARGAHPAHGVHVWEHNNLAQKNLTIVNLIAGDFFILPVRISNLRFGKPRKFKIEIRKEKDFPANHLAIIHQPALIDKKFRAASVPVHEYFRVPQIHIRDKVFECGGHEPRAVSNNMITSKNIDSFVLHNPESIVSELHGAEIPSFITQFEANDQAVIAVKMQAPKAGIYKFDIVQRDDRTNRVIGGVAVELRVK